METEIKNFTFKLNKVDISNFSNKTCKIFIVLNKLKQNKNKIRLRKNNRYRKFCCYKRKRP
jgi:hypothetical protein